MSGREQKGITLIALIITIIVMLILAVVALRAVQGDGIIFHARKASSEHDRGQKEEEKQLSKTQYELARAEFEQAKAKGQTTARTPDEYILEKTYGVKIKIGDYVTYNPGSHTHTLDVSKGVGGGIIGGSNSVGWTLGKATDGTQTNLGWRVLGANSKGELQLISSTPTPQSLYLANDKGYVYAEENLNNFCNDLYGKGTYATGARSLNVDDINKLTNYNPNTYSGYGEKWIYRATEKSSYIEYSKDGGKSWRSTGKTTFRLPEETTGINQKNPGKRELIHENYTYNIKNNLTVDDGFSANEVAGISDMITCGSANQWLASTFTLCYTDNPSFRVRRISSGEVKDQYLFVSRGHFVYGANRVRPVVSISTDVKLTRPGSSWQISK